MKGHTAGEHLVNDYPQRIDIRAGIQLVAPHTASLLVRHVRRRAEHHAGLRVGRRFAQLGNAEIYDLGDEFPLVAARKKKVVGLEVAMNNAQPVRRAQAPRHLLKDFRNIRHAKRPPPPEGLAQRFAFQKFHGNVGRAIVRLGRFVNGDDVRVMNESC